MAEYTPEWYKPDRANSSPPDYTPNWYKPEPRGIGDTVADVGSGLLSGAVAGTAKAAGGALSLANTILGGYPERIWKPVQAGALNLAADLTGNEALRTRPEDIPSWSQGTEQTAQALGDALSSEGLQRRQAEHAGDSWAFLKDPAIAAQTIGGFAPYVAAGLASGGTLPALAVNTGLLAGGATQSVQQHIQNEPADQLAARFPDYPALAARVGDQEARARLAQSAGLKAGLVAGGVGGLAGPLVGGAVGGRIAGAMTGEGLLPAIARGAIQEGAAMAPLMGGSQMGENVGLNRPMLENVPEQAAIGAVMGGIMGGARGAMARPKAEPTASKGPPVELPPAGLPPEPGIAAPPAGLNEPIPDTGPISRAANLGISAPTPLASAINPPARDPYGDWIASKSQETGQTPLAVPQGEPPVSPLPATADAIAPQTQARPPVELPARPERAGGAPVEVASEITAPAIEPAQPSPEISRDQRSQEGRQAQTEALLNQPQSQRSAGAIENAPTQETMAAPTAQPPLELPTGPAGTGEGRAGTNGEGAGKAEAVTPPSTLQGLAVREIPLDRLSLSGDVPQFKSDANPETGVVEPLGGKYDRVGTAPIIVWERADGRQEVISGRHRLDLARRSGETSIPAQVLREADGFTARQAAILDAELNIRDNQGKVKDYVQYVKGSGIDRAEAERRGLLARAMGQRAHAIATEGGEGLIAAHRADILSDEAAWRIARTAPGNERLQAVGIKAVQDGKSLATATNLMQAVKTMAAERGMSDSTGDMFGFDDSAIREAETMAKIATRHQRQLSEQLAAVQGAAKRPEQARKLGVDVADPQAVIAKIGELKAERDAWENWSTNPELVARIRDEATPRENAGARYSKSSKKSINVDGYELPLNPDGTVTLYHHTNRESVDRIRETGILKSAAEPDVYLTTEKSPTTGYGDAAIALRVDPKRLRVDDEFPSGRLDFRMDTGRPGGSVRIKIEEPRKSIAEGFSATPAGTARTLAEHPEVKALGDRISVVERQADLRPELQPKDGGPVKAVIDNSKIVLVGEHWTPEDLANLNGVLQHEGGVHLAKDSGFYDPQVQAAGKVLRAVGLKALAGEASWNDLTRKLDALRQNGNASVRRAFDAAERARTSPGLLHEEALGYLAELNPKHSMIRRLAATVKAALWRMGVKVTLGDAELVALARIGLRREIQMAERPKADAITVAALRLLRQDADLFQNKPASSKDLAGIFREIDPGIRVTRDMTPTELSAVGADSGTALTMPDGAEAFVMRRKNAVWVDASQLQEGRSRGSALYAAVADYAHNNGMVFQGDPAGLSDIAKLRRTENMLASAIKHGTTDHLWPHEKQGIEWTGNNDRDFQALIQKSMDNILGKIPNLKAVRYDFDRRQFINIRTGRPVGEADFAALANTPGARAAQAGSATLERTALLNTLARGEGGTSGTNGTGRGRALLGDVVRELRAGVASGPLRGVVYSRAGVLAQQVADRVPDSAKEWGNELLDGFKRYANPMAMGTGSERAKALAKDYANTVRASRYEAVTTLRRLTKEYSPADLKRMWDAMDESSVAATNLEQNGMSRADAMAEVERQGIGAFALPDAMRAEVMAFSRRADANWENAKRVGLVEKDAAGLPFWTPRTAALIGEDGTFGKVDATGKASATGSTRPLDMKGANFTTRSANLLHRKHVTAAETEAAMQAKFGPDAGIVRDIRAMPLAMSRLEQAIAGRDLINRIKQISAATGAVEDFTLDHPSFQTYKPRLEQDAAGNWQTVKDANGDIVFDKVPIRVAREFEGPLRAVLGTKPGAWYTGLMKLKSSALSLIMYSPMIHNAVIWGKALPAMPGKVASFKVYFEGNRIKQDPVQMREFMQAGLVPINQTTFHPDIPTAITNLSGHEPGLVSGAISKGIGAVSKSAGEATARTLSQMGNFWHNTLLWDRVGDLQVGIAHNFREELMAKGMDRQTATRIAAHFGNRFAGAMPKEALGEQATWLANLSMFSRTFTLGNLSIMKDMLAGLPGEVKAQILRDAGPTAAAVAAKTGRKIAIHAMLMDIGLMYATNALLQGGFDLFQNDKTLDDVEKGYARRFSNALKAAKENPLELLSFPARQDPTSENEPGKEGRILIGRDQKTGTATYLRFPTGKVGEEFVNWFASPLNMMRKKMSTLARPAMETFANRDWSGRPVYDIYTPGIEGKAKAVGQVVAHFASAQVPVEAIASGWRSLAGEARRGDVLKSIGPLLGVTFSHGYSGGPELGEIAAANRRQEALLQEIRPTVVALIQDGDIPQAVRVMADAHMTAGQMRALVASVVAPQSRLNPTKLRQFGRIAAPEEMDRLKTLLESRSSTR